MKRGLKITLWTLGTLLALIVLATLVAAPVAKSYINSHGEELVGRKVHIDGLRLNVYTGHVAIHNLSLYEADGTNLFARFDTLDVRARLLPLLIKEPSGLPSNWLIRPSTIKMMQGNPPALM